MKQIIKKLFSNIKFLINWQHAVFYFLLLFIVIYFLIFDYKPELKNLNFNNITYSLGRSFTLSLIVSLLSMLIGVFLVFIHLTKIVKHIKAILNNIFIFPEVIYIFILLFLMSPINIQGFILILSVIRAYSFFNISILEIEEVENKQFIDALYSTGLKRQEIIIKHILPIISIPVIIFFFETIIWFIVIEFILNFINIIPVYPDLSGIGYMIHNFIETKSNLELFILIAIFYLFVFELNYIISNIKLKFEVLFKKSGEGEV